MGCGGVGKGGSKSGWTVRWPYVERYIRWHARLRRFLGCWSTGRLKSFATRFQFALLKLAMAEKKDQSGNTTTSK